MTTPPYIPSFTAEEQLLAMGPAILTVKQASLNVKKLLTVCFSEGKLRLFDVARGCTRRL